MTRAQQLREAQAKAAERLALVQNYFQRLISKLEAPRAAWPGETLAALINELSRACGDGERAVARQIANLIFAGAVTETELIHALEQKYIPAKLLAQEQHFLAALDAACALGWPELIGPEDQVFAAAIARHEFSTSPGAGKILELVPVLLAEEREAGFWTRFASQIGYVPAHELNLARINNLVARTKKSAERATSIAAKTSDPENLKVLEKEFRLPALRSTSEKQKYFARQLRAEHILRGQAAVGNVDMENLRSLKSARQVIDLLKHIGKQK